MDMLTEVPVGPDLEIHSTEAQESGLGQRCAFGVIRVFLVEILGFNEIALGEDKGKSRGSGED